MLLKKLLSPILLILLVLLSLPAMASTQCVSCNGGRIVTMSGDVMVNGHSISKSYQIKSGDKITTGSDGKINIIMSDKSVLDLQPNTSFRIERFSFSRANPKKSRSIMNLISGGFRYISGLVGRTNHNNATIKMGTATAGIIGSFASFGYDGATITATAELGQMSIAFADGSTMTVNRGQTGRANANGSSPRVAKSSKGDGYVLSTAILAAKSDTGLIDALNNNLLTDAEKAMVIAILVANPQQLGLTDAEVQSKVKAVVASDPNLAPLVSTIVGAVAKDSTTASGLTDAIKSVEGVDDAAVDKAATEGSKIIDASSDDGAVTLGATNETYGDTETTISGGGGDNTASGSSP